MITRTLLLLTWFLSINLLFAQETDPALRWRSEVSIGPSIMAGHIGAFANVNWDFIKHPKYGFSLNGLWGVGLAPIQLINEKYQPQAMFFWNLGFGFRLSDTISRAWIGPEFLLRNAYGIYNRNNIRGLGVGVGLRVNYAFYFAERFGFITSIGLGALLAYTEKEGKHYRTKDFRRNLAIPGPLFDAHIGVAMRL
ncbi:MAG: hypothetical protein AAF975_02000 [Spirochaetota bacterium]